MSCCSSVQTVDLNKSCYCIRGIEDNGSQLKINLSNWLKELVVQKQPMNKIQLIGVIRQSEYKIITAKWFYNRNENK